MSAQAAHASLDADARRYYLSNEVADVAIEDAQQRLSIERIVEAAGTVGRVLEMGYGMGLTVQALLDRGVDLEVVEGSGLLCEAAAKRHPGLGVHHALFEHFTPADPYDAVLALHVAEHVEDPRALLTRVASWLKPGGRIVVVVPNSESLHRRLAVRMGLQGQLDDLSERDHLVGHRRVYALDGLVADLEAAGFDVTDDFGWFLKTVPNAMMLDWPSELIEALTTISEEIPTRLLANIAVVAERR